MTGIRKARELDFQVWDWLQKQSPPVHFVNDYSKAANTEEKVDLLNADFLVLRPFPIAIITVAPVNPSAFRKKGRRLLAQRIALAERFGNYLPVVVIVPTHASIAFLPFADLILSADDLPELKELKGRLSLDQGVQTILQDGEPSEVKFSTEEDVTAQWSNIVTLEDLADTQITYPEESLAKSLQKSLVLIKRFAEDMTEASEICELADVLDNEESLPRKRHAPSSSMAQANPNDSQTSWWSRSRHWSDSFDRDFYAFVVKACGGKMETKRQRYPNFGVGILRHLWKAPSGGEFVLRRLTVTADALYSKVPELVAEAWMTRAFFKKKVRSQILLLGEMGSRPVQPDQLGNPSFEERTSCSFHVQHVNALEAAGWIVAPWDFNKIEPCFIKILKEVGHD